MKHSVIIQAHCVTYRRTRVPVQNTGENIGKRAKKNKKEQENEPVSHAAGQGS